MQEGNLNEMQPNELFGLFTDAIIDEAFGVHDVRLTSNDLDAMFYYCLSTDDIGMERRQTMIASYFSMKRMLEALVNKCFPEDSSFVVNDPFFK